jgi:probable HAF family extracellular repeat protein
MDERAFLYNGSTFLNLTLSGSRSYAYGINQAGHVVGQATTAGNAETHAFLFNGEAVLDLGTLGGTQSIAHALNALGHVVGASTTAGNATTHATFYTGGILYDLNSLVPAPGGWVFSEALGINDAGAIVGHGLIGGQQHAFLLTPIPEPSTYALIFGAGVLGLAAWRRRRSMI